MDQNIKNTTVGAGLPPSLVLWITIDQQMADLFQCLEERLGQAGFHNLNENGIWFKNAAFLH